VKTRITSMADFYYRVSKDERYKLIAIKAYRASGHCKSSRMLDTTYEESIEWIECWLSDCKASGYTPYHCTEFNCSNMIEYINQKAEQFKYD